jgi:hypothetical protein
VSQSIGIFFGGKSATLSDIAQDIEAVAGVKRLERDATRACGFKLDGLLGTLVSNPHVDDDEVKDFSAELIIDGRGADLEATGRKLFEGLRGLNKYQQLLTLDAVELDSFKPSGPNATA